MDISDIIKILIFVVIIFGLRQLKIFERIRNLIENKKKEDISSEEPDDKEDDEEIDKLEDKNLFTQEQLQEICNEVCRRTERNAHILILNTEREPSIFDSKFGGIPYWDLSMEYPAAEDGEKLYPIAQINLKDLKPLNNADGIELPAEGMLQFFIKQDNLFGMNFDRLDSQKDFRVVYHKAVDMNVTEEQLKALGVPELLADDYHCNPLSEPCALDFTQKKVSITCSDIDFDKIFKEVAKEKFNVERDFDVIDVFENYDDMYNSFAGSQEHMMLGHPNFTQYDPRNEDYACYNVQLLQIETEGELLCWGDAGVANFFINGDDLRNENFSCIAYTWDCC